MRKILLIIAISLLTIPIFSQGGMGWVQSRVKNQFRDSVYFYKDANFNAPVRIGVGNLRIGGVAITPDGNEINILNGLLSNTTELNRLVGVTANVQTQLDGKAPLVNPNFTTAARVGGDTLMTKTRSQAMIDYEKTKAVPLSSYTYLRSDSGKLSNPISLYYFNTHSTGGAVTGGYNTDNLQWVVGTTPGAPSNGDSIFTVPGLAGKEIKLYRGTTKDLPLQDLNRTATNGRTGYRFNSSGTIVVRPVWATGDRARIEAIPSENSNWITLSSSAAYFTETFEATGYDNAVWNETVGSGVVYEDETGVTPPSGGGSQVLKVEKTGPSYNAWVYGELAAAQVVSYTTLYVYVGAHGLSSTETMSIFGLYEASYANFLAGASLYVDSYDSDNLKFICDVNHNGTNTTVAWPGAGANVALNTWYKFNIKYDITGNAYEVLITPAGGSPSSVMTGPLVPSHPTAGLKIIQLGPFSVSETATYYFDNVSVGTTAYPTF